MSEIVGSYFINVDAIETHLVSPSSFRLYPHLPRHQLMQGGLEQRL